MPFHNLRKVCLGVTLSWLAVGLSWADQTSTATVSGSQSFTVSSSPLGGVAGCNLSVGSRTYGTTTFVSGAAGRYSFEVTGGTGSIENDPFLAVYRGSFDPSNPTANLVGCNDDGLSLYSLFTATLEASTTYVAVATSFGGGAQTGTISFSIGADPTIVLSSQSIALGTTGASMVATSDSPVSITYSSSNTSVATINASTGALTLVAAGSTTITATQAAQASPGLFRAGTQTASLTVTAPAASLSPSSQVLTSPAGAAMTASSVISGSGFTGAVTYSVTPSLPAGLSLDSSTGVISGTPTATQNATSYTITGAGATSGSATASVSIAVTAGVQATLVVSASPSTIRANKTSTLTTTGGSGSGAVSYSVTTGACTVSGSVLTAAPSSGTCTILATKAADVTYAAATASVTVTINPSLAQALDASVKGTVTAHAMTATRFTDAQVRNVTSRIETLGRGFNLNSGRVALGFQSPAFDAIKQASPILLAAADSLLVGDDRSTVKDSTPVDQHSGDRMGPRWLLADLGQQGKKGQAQSGGGQQATYAFWISGSFVSGKVDIDSSSTNRFRTDGVTVGFDYLLTPKTVIGLALGHGDDRTKVDPLGTKVSARQVSLMAYGVTSPREGFLLDGLFGVGNLDYSNDRFSTLSSALFTSKRKGDSRFLSAGLSMPTTVEKFEVKPYVRAHYNEVSLGAYNEGSDVNALAYDRARLHTGAYAAGVSAQFNISGADGGVWTPIARLEMRRNLGNQMDQSISFVDTPSDVAQIQVGVAPRGMITSGLGVSYKRANNLTFGLGWVGAIGSNSYRSSGVRLEVGVPF